MRYKSYLDEVCKYVRFKAAHRALRDELTAHIDDKRNVLETQGIENAEQQAVAAMGDAAQTGKALNTIHKPRIEWAVIASVVLLCVIGLLMLVFVGGGVSFFADSTVGYHAVSIAIGLALMAVVMFIDYTKLVRFRAVFFAAALAVGSIAILTQSDSFFAGEYYYFETGFVHWMLVVIEPLLFLLSFVGFMQSNKEKGVVGLIKIGALCGVSLFALCLLPSLMNILVLLIVYLAVFCAAIHKHHFAYGRRWPYYAIMFIGIFAGVFVTLMMFGSDFYARLTDRVISIDATAEGYCTAQARNMLAGAKPIGPSDYWIAHGFRMLPHSSTYYMLTSVVAVYGWLAGIGIALVFIAMFTLLICRSRRIAHPFGKMLATAVSAFLLVQFIASALVNLGVFGGIGTSLPFLSLGRLDLAVNAVLVGIFLSVWRASSFMRKDTQISHSLLFVKTKH